MPAQFIEDVRLKWVLKAMESGRRETNDVDTTNGGGVLSIGGEHVGWRGEWQLENPRYISRNLFTAMTSGVVQTNDILLVKDGATIGKTAIADNMLFDEAAVNEHVLLLRVSDENYPRYYFYVIQSPSVQMQIWLNVRGSAQPGLTSEFRNNVIVPKPSRLKQEAIAHYLDRETTRLDALVLAKERVLGLLAEKRRALITRAVSRGLDPSAPLRDSGIPWLGEIPAHWKLKRLKYVGRAIIGLTFDPADTVTDGSGILVLRASNVRDQKIALDNNLFVLMDIPEILRTRVGDILICSRSGSRGLIGKNALIDHASVGLTFGAFMTVFRSPHNEFLFYMFNSPIFDYQAGAFSTSTISQLTVETLNGMEVPLPPPSEQEAIVASLRESMSHLDRLIDVTDRTIALLKERRASLIAAAVTGQIDVEKTA